MLDFIYYPISGIMWVWHWLFSHILPDTPGGNGIAWTLSVVFLVFTLRALLYKPFVKQIRTTKKMQEIQPQMAAIRKKYPKDRVKQSEEMQKLQKEHGFNPLLGCLPMLVQIPVFIGLFHVLRSFNRMGTGFGQLGMSAEQTRETHNYFFSADLVANFLDSRLFGVPLSSAVNQPSSEWLAFSTDGHVDFSRLMIVALVVPLMIISAIATHLNARASVARQGAAALENPQTQIMNKLALYVFPLGILVSGAFFPVAIVLYWVANNLWTYGQQHIVFGRMEKEEEEAKAAKKEKQAANAPKPGAKPVDKRKKKASAQSVDGATGDSVEGAGAAAAGADGSTKAATDNGKTAGSSASGAQSSGTKTGDSAGGDAAAADGQGVTRNSQRPATKRPSKKDRAAARRANQESSSNSDPDRAKGKNND